MTIMDERVLTPEGREAVVSELLDERTNGRASELRDELQRGPQPECTPDPDDEPIGTLLRLLPGGRLELTEHTPRGMSPERERPGAVVAVRSVDESDEADPGDWQAAAVCVENPRATDAETPQETSTALAMCGRCTVVAQCRAWADSEPQFMGVAGGQVYGDSRSKKSQAREVA